MTKRLDRLLSLIRDASRARFLGSRSFSHELEAKHVQQVTQGGGFTAFGDDGTLTFEYRVPERVCFRGDSYLPLSVLLAIVDEVTSWASVGVDPARRPGVSIDLNAALAAGRVPPRAGDHLVFLARSRRMGRTLGFQTCEVRTGSGELVATARHTKLLDMGRAWGIAFGAGFDLTRGLLRAFGSVDRPLPTLSPTVGGLLRPEACEVEGEAGGVGRAMERHRVAGGMLNEVGLLFGGCQALLHERAAGLAADCAVGHGGLVLGAMSVTYLAAAKRGQSVEARATARAAWGGESTSGLVATSCLFAGSGKADKVVSEARMRFHHVAAAGARGSMR